MGLFKKIFKPVAKVLDKIVPNEIKPALPFAAAFLPMIPGFGGAASGLGKALGFSKYASGIGGGILGAGANIFSQLAQEGNEEADINLLSAGLGALTSGLAAQGPAAFSNQLAGTPDYFPPTTAAGKLKEAGLAGLEKGAKFLQPLTDPGFNLATAKAAALPAATATGDLMQAEARQLEKQAAIDAALAEAEALADAGMRGDAIRNAMRAYGFFTDDEIESTVSSAGYRAGGRVGFNIGGPTAGQGLSALLGSDMLAREGMKDAEDKPFKFDAQQFMIDQFNEEGVQPEIIGEGVFGDMLIIRTPNGGSMSISTEDFIANFGEPPMKAKGIERDALDQPYRYKAGGRAGYRFGGIDKAIEGVSEEMQEEGKEGIMMAAKEDPLLVEEYNKYVFDLLENRPDAKPMTFNEFKRMIMSGMKDGGLMDLGGKEMDLRGGGFVPIGKKERADDVPARLSKNEFVMTADAVRAAGGGSVNEGAKRMYKVMNDLEARA